MLTMEQILNMPSEEFDKLVLDDLGKPDTPDEPVVPETPEHVETQPELQPEADPNTELDTPVVPENPELNEDGTPVVPTQEGAEVQPTTEEPNYKEMYESLMAPVEVNGVAITPRNAEELKTLVQRGLANLNATGGMEAHRKTIMTLEKAGLLGDDATLDYLVSLSQKDPAAIRKLLTEAEYDPLNPSNDEVPEYAYRGHVVSKDEADFSTAISQVKSQDQGTETLNTILQTWDETSINELQKRPVDLQVIHDHMRNGIYQTVASEVHRSKLLGQIPNDTPFIQAYRYIGDMLDKQGAFSKAVEQAKPPAAQPVARGVMPTNKEVVPLPAGATSSPRAAPQVQAQAVNPFELSKDKFDAAYNKMFK